MAKWFLKSRVFWLNVLALLLSVVDMEWSKINTLFPNIILGLFIFLCVGNLVLRWYTIEPVTFKRHKKHGHKHGTN